MTNTDPYGLTPEDYNAIKKLNTRLPPVIQYLKQDSSYYGHPFFTLTLGQLLYVPSHWMLYSQHGDRQHPTDIAVDVITQDKFFDMTNYGFPNFSEWLFVMKQCPSHIRNQPLPKVLTPEQQCTRFELMAEEITE